MVTVPFSLDVLDQCILCDKKYSVKLNFVKTGLKVNVYVRHYASVLEVIHLNITRIAFS